MDKLIKVSHGTLQARDQSKTSTLVLEKNSADLSGQLSWLTDDVNRIDPRIAAWIRSSPLDHERYAYAIVVPLGADESWEETVNGDAFLREDLAPENPEWGHKSFETYANAFRHHVNHDPARGFGRNPFMVFNRESDRCEGIWQLDRAKARDVGAQSTIDKLEGGKVVSLSMGCRVKFDRCSICGNEAPSPAMYCVHPRNPGFGSVDPYTGHKVRVFNPRPTFFDLSDVTVPAAPESATLGHLSAELERFIRANVKTSGVRWPVVPSAVLGEALWGDVHKLSAGKASALKLSDLIKYAPALAVGITQPLTEQEPSLSFEGDLDSCRNRVTQTLVTLAGLGIVLRFKEFLDLRGQSSYPGDLCAEDAAAGFRSATASPAMDPGWFDRSLAQRFSSLVEDRSLLMPYLGRRAASLKSEAKASPAGGTSSPVVRSGQSWSFQYGEYLGQVARSLASLVSSLREAVSDFDDRFLGLESLTAEGVKRSTGLDPAVRVALPALHLLGYGKLSSHTDLLEYTATAFGSL